MSWPPEARAGFFPALKNYITRGDTVKFSYNNYYIHKTSIETVGGFPQVLITIYKAKVINFECNSTMQKFIKCNGGGFIQHTFRKSCILSFKVLATLPKWLRETKFYGEHGLKRTQQHNLKYLH